LEGILDNELKAKVMWVYIAPSCVTSKALWHRSLCLHLHTSDAFTIKMEETDER